MTEGSLLRSLLGLSIPVVLTNLLQTAYQLINTFWVGRLGTGPLAAASVSVPITFLLLSLGGGLSVAGSTLIAQYAGARNRDMVNHIAAQTILMVMLASAVLSVVGFLLAPHILRLMGVEARIFGMAVQYLRVSFLGIVFMFTFAMFQSLLRGVGEVRMALYIVLATVLLNGLLAPMFIRGWGPLPAGGVVGAAWATLVTQGIAALVGFTLLLGNRYGIHLRARDFRPDLRLIRRTFLLGLPASIEQSSRALGLTILTFLVTSFGTLAIATYGVGMRLLSVIFIPALGLSMATTTVVAQNIGAGQEQRAVEVARLSAWLAFGILSLIRLIVFLSSRPIVRFFVPGDPELVESAALFVRIAAISFGFMGAQQALAGAFRGAGQMFMTMLLAIGALWVLQFPLAYVLSKHTALGVVGIWWATPVSNVLLCLVSVVWFMGGTWHRKNLTREEELDGQVAATIRLEEG